MNRPKHGFTLVEVLVVITVIGILMAISTFAYITFQGDARDNQRSTKATLITEALEKYYNKNGEYPSPKALTNDVVANTGASVASKLSLNQDVLLMPKAASGTTNSIATTLGTADVITYAARSDINNANCQNVATSGCDEFTVTYKKERTNEVVTIKSRHSGRPDGFETAPIAPAAPTITAAQSSTNLMATSSVAACQTGTVAKYSFQNRAGTAAWSAWSAWQANRTFSRGSNTDGVVYTFQVRVRCDIGTVVGDTSATSAPVTITYQAPLAAPSTPTITAALSGANAVGTSTVATCQAGSTVQYRIDRRTNTGTWTTGTWGTGRTYSVTAVQGTRHGFRVAAQCVRGTETAVSAVSAEATYIHPISTPSAPSVSVSTSGDVTTYTRSDVACPAGTTTRYQVKFLADWNYESAWAGPTTGQKATTWNTASQGYQYRVQLQAHCYTTYATSGWSGTGTGSYIRPVSPPGPISFSISRGASNIVYVYAASSCHSSVGLYSRADVHTWDYQWLDTGTLGWYANSHGGVWVQHAWGYYGNQIRTGATNGSRGAYNSGSRWNIATEMMCRNSQTGRASAGTGRRESPTMYLP